MLRSTPLVHVSKRVPDESLVRLDQRFGIPFSHDALFGLIIWRKSSIQRQESSIGCPSVIHKLVVPGLASRSRRRLRLKRAAADIFALGFLSMLANPRVTGGHNRSSQARRQFLPGTATRRRT